MAKFQHSKENFQELGKDAVCIVTSTVSMLKDIIQIPVAFYKDVKEIRDEYLLQKQKSENAKKEYATPKVVLKDA